ncbi:MAG: AAA family ATPase, partial [Pseudomonadales bacterium]|nr:AAA family ATPase [Pseudomonadales bacterium]
WEALKRALFDREVRPENAGEQLGFGRTSSLEAEPVELDLKVVLVGQRRTYYLLSALEPDFAQLFKVPADLEDRVERSAENAQRYARNLAAVVEDEGLRPVTAAAVARILDHSVRLAGDVDRLTAHAHRVADLLREADHFAAAEKAERIDSEHVETAVRLGAERLDRIRRDVHERITEGTVLIDTEGRATGQVNGLSVLQVGEIGFGQPSRITANARLGHGEVIDIEREARLGGPVHSKAVMILTAFLGQRYARELPLSLAATLVFEQSYGGIEGDSASVAELCALLSAIGELPLRQDIAVTGSMNQHGRVQAIGGANEKVEGFHDVCAARGLSGTQGVLLPADNARHLMLRSDVVEAVAAGRFTVHVMEEIEDAMELLTGLPRGACEAGQWTPDSFDARIAAGLARFTEAGRALQDTGARTIEREAAATTPEQPPGPPPGPEDQR